jgi:cytosine deaminase
MKTKGIQAAQMHGIDLKFMEAAMEEARKSMTEGGIPIGAILVKDGAIIGRGHNMRIQTGNRMAHAEIDCLEDAIRSAGKQAVEGSTLYSTLMPCHMCAGAVVHYGVGNVVGAENQTFPTGERILQTEGVRTINLELEEYQLMLQGYVDGHQEHWQGGETGIKSLRRKDSATLGANWALIEHELQRLVTRLHAELGWFDDESVANTPRMVAGFYRELYEEHAGDLRVTQFDGPASKRGTLITQSRIKTYSICIHHMLPFECNVSIGYVPENGRVIGLSKLSRVAAKFASKPTMQERMTQDIVDFLQGELKPSFVICLAEGIHHCSVIRGVCQQSATFTTSAMNWNHEKLGEADADRLKEEFLVTIRYANGGIYDRENKTDRT